MYQRVIPLFLYINISNFVEMNRFVVYILLVFSLIAPCIPGQAQTAGVTRETAATDAIQEAAPGLIEEYLQGYYSQVFGFEIPEMFNSDLYSSIEKWLGTPYRYAGKSLEGIDCSSFVNRIYETVYCCILTGNSAEIAQQVTKLPKENLREGDLVFFKINKRNISHVGVYLGDDKFAHASTSKGVIISDLNSPYYRKYFVKAGRINFPTN